MINLNPNAGMNADLIRQAEESYQKPTDKAPAARQDGPNRRPRAGQK